MPIDWKSPEAFTRLLAAMVAAQDMKLNYKKIAELYGQGATYDSIEGRFRIIKREAKTLTSTLPTTPDTNTPKTPTKPKNQSSSRTTTPKKEKVMNGRITKSATPSKRSNGNVVKGVKEEMASSESSFLGEDAGIIAEMGDGDGWQGLGSVDFGGNGDWVGYEDGVMEA